MPKITKKTVDFLLLQEIGTVIRDSDLIGFQAVRLATTVSYRYEYRDGLGRSSQVRRFVIGRHGKMSLTAARAIAKKYSLAKVGKRGIGDGVPTLSEFADAYLSSAEAGIVINARRKLPSSKTIKNYRSLMRCHVGPALGDRRMNMISPADVRAFHRSLSRTNPIVSNRCLQIVSSLFGLAAAAGHVTRGGNPTRDILKNEENIQECLLGFAEMFALGEAIRVAETVGIPYSPKLKPGKKAKNVPKSKPPYVISRHAANAIRLIALTGAKPGELLSIKWTDVDLEGGSFARRTATGLNHSPIAFDALEVLRQMSRVSEYVFPMDSDYSRPMSSLKKQWSAVRGLAGLPGVRLLDLRHTFAMLTASSGASTHVLAALLGHVQLKSSQRYEGHRKAEGSSHDPIRLTAEEIADKIGYALGGGL